MIGLLALLVRFILLAVFTFGFVVLFEHGPAEYPDNAVVEWRHFVGFVQERAGLKAPEAAPITPTPAAPIAPAESPAPTDVSTPAPAPANP